MTMPLKLQSMSKCMLKNIAKNFELNILAKFQHLYLVPSRISRNDELILLLKLSNLRRFLHLVKK